MLCLLRHCLCARNPKPIRRAGLSSGVSRVSKPVVVLVAAGLALSACADQNPFVVKRTACPAVAVLANAGETTLFAPADSRDADAIDVVATITNVRATCNDTGAGNIVSAASYDVIARRTNGTGARDVTFPTFAAVMRAGTQLVAKQTGQVTVRFADGQTRATGQGRATGQVDRASASLSADINQKIERKRKPGDLDAAIDPLAAPDVRAAVRNASFELLLGFQLDEAALAYNVTK